MGTWLWGSSRARNQQFDPKADLYGLCFCFADVSMARGTLARWRPDLCQARRLQLDRLCMALS